MPGGDRSCYPPGLLEGSPPAKRQTERSSTSISGNKSITRSPTSGGPTPIVSVQADYSATLMFTDRFGTYAHYWDGDEPVMWAKHQMKTLFIIASYVGQTPGNQGLDWDQAHRTIKFAEEWGLSFLAAGPDGADVKVPITEETMRPWIGLWMNAPFHGNRLLTDADLEEVGMFTYTTALLDAS